ncbi:MAG: alpha/beta hydrolase family protein, partial [Actinomycetes bacterium]
FLADAMDVPGGLYWQRSPVFHVADCTTPTMLTVGAHDRCTPPDQAIEFHEALRERGVPTELVIYPEDAHNVPRGPGLVDWLDRTVRWFERWCPPR